MWSAEHPPDAAGIHFRSRPGDRGRITAGDESDAEVHFAAGRT